METSCDEDRLKLSIAGPSSSSSRAQDQLKIEESSGSMETADCSRLREIKKRFLEIKKYMSAMRFAVGPMAENWLSLSPPCSFSYAPILEIAETLLDSGRRIKKRRGRPSSFKKSEVNIPDCLPFKKQKISETNTQEPKKDIKPQTMQPQPSLRKADQPGGWRQRADLMGLTRHVLYLENKNVSRSDTDANQNRLQLTKSDINNKAAQPLKDLADEAESGTVIPVKVLDKEGNKYDVVFKYLRTSRTYRFMGRGYSKFVKGSGLREGEMIAIWGLARENGGNREIWLSFVNSDERNY
ncbi:uncharacterized protein A4U43_C01F16760 [Asparagus officinalis]|uniref:EH domain-containing protein n=1 Tax=Asparagus officinalis TaxID=4686 RepID=A0A5P1FPY1_ASPOF|nr:uncharacterized protein A4U43_C01F16760 [Asparagus officinalis]